MCKNNALYILMTTIFCFSQIVEVNMQLWRDRIQESVFVAMDVQRNNILVQGTNKAFIAISDQNIRENTKSIIGKMFEKVLLFGIDFVLGKVTLKAVSFLKRWAEARFSQAFADWKASLYKN
ncbi:MULTISPECIES: hypothetical protein [Bartonella]|uniref:hypothetical protein n=1 Tax=Bartonella TaxID=773 RepID=UPI00119FD721|nr:MULTISPECIES: hypothetical protein [Bartonella]